MVKCKKSVPKAILHFTISTTLQNGEMNTSESTRNVTFITKKVDSGRPKQSPESTFLLINVTVRANFEI